MTPYEFTRASGFFEEEGLSVELVYARGGNAAMQAMVGGAVDYAATSFDVAVQAFANGADIRRFATTGRLPLFALAVAPGEVDAIASLNDLQGKTVGVSALGNADHTLLLYLLTEAGADASSVSFAVLGPNLFEALRRGQVAAGMVQEPALTLIVEDGGKVLFNAMEIADTERLLGGPYEFMGIAYRAEEREERLDADAAAGPRARARPAGAAHRADPRDPRVAAERAAGRRRRRALRRDHRPLPRLALSRSRWRSTSRPAQRVVDALEIGGVLTPDIDLDALLDTEVVPA